MSCTELTVNFTVDWIAATFDKEQGFGFVNSLTEYGKMPGVECHGTKGYNKGYEYKNGMLVSWHTELPENGVHVVFSGATLRKVMADGVAWKELFCRIDTHHGRTSRVDLAFDIKDGALTNESFEVAALKPYKGKGRTPKFVKLVGGDGSWTTYIGSRQSEKFLRIYDKAKEQKDYVSDYVRVELETKGECAHAVGWNFARLGTDECVGMAKTLLLGVADFDIPSWDIAFEHTDVDFSFPQGKEKDTFSWLLKQCVPSLAKEIAKRPEEPVLEQFWDALRDALALQGISSASVEENAK
jgi:hypothetical protein